MTTNRYPQVISGFATIKKAVKPIPLSEYEQSLMDDILASCTEVYHAPTDRYVYGENGITPTKYEILGFEDEHHYVGWCYFNSVFMNDADPTRNEDFLSRMYEN